MVRMCASIQHIETETKYPRFAESIFEFIFLCKNCCILFQISQESVPKGPINGQ